MPLSKDKLAKLLKAVRKGSSHRVKEVVDFSRKYRKYVPEIGRQLEKFISKTSKDNLKGALFVIDALCTSDRAQRAKDKEQGINDSSTAPIDEDEVATAPYTMFREYFNHLDRLKYMFRFIMKAPESDQRHIGKILVHWGQNRWFSEECRAFLVRLFEGGDGHGDAEEDGEGKDVIVSGGGDHAPDNDDDDIYVDNLPIDDIPLDELLGIDFGQTSDIFGGVGVDVGVGTGTGTGAGIEEVGVGSNSTVFDYYDDDEDEDDERRIEEQRRVLEAQRKVLEEEVQLPE